jgi:hypothetical protein
VREVLRRLPGGTTAGLARIRLCDPYREIVEAGADPNLCEVPGMLGVLASPVLGEYRRRNAEIVLFGYLLLRPRRLSAKEHRGLRREFVETLLHEIAHHVDCQERRRGARIPLPGRRRAEDFAEGAADEWVESLVDAEFLTSLRHAEAAYGVSLLTRDAVSAIFIRAAVLAAAVGEWERSAWIECLVDAAESDGAHPREVLSFASEPLDRYLVANPGSRDTRDASIAVFRAVAESLSDAP